jgi:hypothetical protein
MAPLVAESGAVVGALVGDAEAAVWQEADGGASG